MSTKNECYHFVKFKNSIYTTHKKSSEGIIFVEVIYYDLIFEHK